jgi:2-hydroxychromene-2-carboxylate isomerase
MINPFDFFFDFASPYSYLAHKQIRNIEYQHNIKINYMPILLGGLLNLAEIKAAAFIPSKAKFMIKDCKLFAKKLNIKFKFNSYFPIQSLNLMRGVLIARKENKTSLYIDKFFDACWKDGLNLNDQKIVDKILEDLNFNLKTYKLKISEQKIKDELIKRTKDAFLKGVFGAPSFIINNKMFWGQDRLEFVLKEAQKNL